MDITPANLNLFFTTLETRWSTAFQLSPVWYSKISTTYSVDSEDWASGWMDPTGPMREWTGSRHIVVPGVETYRVKMQVFEKTLGIDMFKLKWDKHGIYYPLAADIGMQAAKWPDYQLRDLLQGSGSQTGVRQIGIDGVAHWSDAHPVDFYDASKGDYCNDFRGGVTINSVTVGGALTTNGYKTLFEEFCSRRSPTGEALGIEPDLVMVPSQLGFTAKVLLQASFYAPPQFGALGSGGAGPNDQFVGTMDNVLSGSCDLMINKDLQGAPTDWYMLATRNPIKPFSWLLNQAPDFVARTSPSDPEVFDRHRYLYGSSAVGAPAWSFPWLSALSGPTAP